MIAPARWVGVYGLSFLVWFFVAAGVFVRPVCCLGLLLVPATWWLLPAEEPPSHRALLFQAEASGRSIEQLVAETLLCPLDEAVDLAVLPELSFRGEPDALLTERAGPAALARRLGCPVVAGVGVLKPFRNLAAVFAPDGTLLGVVSKQRPVPLFNDGIPEPEQPVFPVEQGTLGVAICYDFDAPAVVAALPPAGATVLVAPTMDRMSWSRTQHEHHALLFRLRAVENDRWVLRAASSGRSEVITPRGVPSGQGVEIAEVGTVVLWYAHRDTFALGGRLAFLGPCATLATLAYLIGFWVWVSRTAQRRAALRVAPTPSTARRA